MFAKLFATFGRRIIMWAVVALATAAARKALDAWAGSQDPIETSGAATPTA